MEPYFAADIENIVCQDRNMELLLSFSLTEMWIQSLHAHRAALIFFVICLMFVKLIISGSQIIELLLFMCLPNCSMQNKQAYCNDVFTMQFNI